MLNVWRRKSMCEARNTMGTGAMLNLNNLKISRKLLLGFSAVVAVISTTGGLALLNINTMNDARAESTQANATMQAIFDAQFRLARQENSVRGWIISQDEYYLERVESHRGKFKDALNNIRELTADEPTQLAFVDEVERAADLWYDGVVPVATDLVRDAGTRGQAGALVGNNGPADQLIAPAEEG
ncbi:MAG TPA: CHASE3 domain-containing protein, partial [Verrucomicrobiae bacterium]|nr:CHASE3 domain-containing protein [Verrucomicrobiae bacterium]